jgi:collagen type IX alpha
LILLPSLVSARKLKNKSHKNSDFYTILHLFAFAEDTLENQFNHGPCGRWRPGDGDLNTFDLIREFHLDQTEERYESITEVGGTNILQRAYRLQKESNLTMRAVEAFPKGVPHQFSFECTYRVRHPPKTAWHLFHLSNYYEESQMTVTMNPRRETLELVLPDVTGQLQTASFRHSSVWPLK